MLRVFERLRIRRLQPAKRGDVFHPARLQSQHDLRQIEALHLGKLLRGPFEMFGLGPKPQAMSGRGPTRPASALIGRRAADFLDEKSVDSTARIEPANPGESAVDHHPNAIDRQGGLRHIRRDDHFALFIGSEGGVLLTRRKFAVKRQSNEAIAHVPGTDG